MRRTIIISIAILVCGLAVMNILKPVIRLPFYGRVIMADTKEPVADALIEVLSNSLDSDGMEQTLTRTTSDGNFSTVARGKARIQVWKPGFQISWIQDQPSFFIWTNNVTITLRKLTPTNLLSLQETDKEMVPNNGFSFKDGRITSNTDTAADLIFAAMPASEDSLFLKCKGNGGILFQPDGEKVDLYNLYEAPQGGYEEQIRIKPKEDGVYFVRTSDGAHYAKMRLWRCCDENPLHYRVQWAYQPDGTRNLELKPGKNFPFPLKEFGIQVD
ncbi:MAG: carboxypeptidase regulatory-like domain-containing protein [Acidobacteria bacterium]|nr:carboxypeptidase regulatory-like domain-containing protein [Acidobacteriota bacterium]